MRAYEFNTTADDTTILIPEQYRGQIPSNVRVIVLPDEPDNGAVRQRKALERYWEDTKDCDEPLGPEFDKIISQRMNIAREVDLCLMV